MARFPSLELRVRVRRAGGVAGWIGSDRPAGLRLRSETLERQGWAWQWVVDVDEGLPALTDVFETCHGFLVDEECGREVGVVEDVIMMPGVSGPAHLVLMDGRGSMVPLDSVVEVAPAGRRLVIACGGGHEASDTEGSGVMAAAFRTLRRLAGGAGGHRRR